jgi:hypothetical protein
MFNLRQVFAFWVALLVLTVVDSAQAQTTPALTATIAVTKTGVTHSAPRSANRQNTYINHADCIADDKITFPLTATNFTGYGFQAWVGTGCTDVGIRKLAGQTSCWKVLDTTFQQVSPNSTGSTTITLPVRSIIAGYTDLFGGAASTTSSAGASSTAGAGGAATVGGSGGTDTGGTGTASTAGVTGATMDSTGVINAGVDACEQPNPQNVQGATNVTVFFMLLDSSSGTAVASDTWVGTFKLVGPQPPDIVTAGIGGNLLVVSFMYSVQSGDTTRNGFNIYCDPAPGSAVAADAGLVGDGGVGTATTCPEPLISDVLVAGNDPPADSKYRCGGGQATSQAANATNLVDGVPYNVAVAAIDSYENTGPLSTLACQVPQPITGFYKAYRDAGGTAGGGFCSFSTKREPVIFLAVLGLASGLLFRRRRAT